MTTRSSWRFLFMPVGLLRYFRSPVLGGSSRRGEVVMAHTRDAEVRPTLKLFWRLSIVPLVIGLPKALIPDLLTGQHFKSDLVFLVGVGLVSLVPALMYARRTRLQRRGNDLVFVNQRGRGYRVPVTDVDLAEVVPFDPSGKVYGRDADRLEQRLILRRRSGAQPVMIDVKRFDIDQIKQLFAGCGITVTETYPKSAKQIQERFPGAQFDAMERHPVLANFIVPLVGFVLISTFVIYVGIRTNWQIDNWLGYLGLLTEVHHEH
jgi:hypothetical protein